MTPIIIDTDPGIDDAMAIFFAAAAPEIELLGLTTVFGNVSGRIAVRNALRLVEAVDLDIPVAEGAWRPRVRPPVEPSWKVHGREGFGTLPADVPRGKAADEGAADFLIRVTAERPGEVTLCAIAPLTNVAEAIDRDPGFASRLKELVIMGGSLDAGGNATPHAEANTHKDPDAAQIVFASGAPIRMVGLDVTNHVICTPSDFALIAHRSPVLGGMLQEMSGHYVEFYQEMRNFDGCALHDPTAIVAAIEPALFEWRRTRVRIVERGEAAGRTIADPACAHAPVEVATRVDAPAVLHRFTEALGYLP
ncbi:nucleoside hydrolase [Aestuariibius sp. 2305UL40-4]|uniref:nucleoside hydrolase n=1 Tax=Aestuariibius violaceus TaxID=3234132 RepID=UPI00345E94A2